MTQICKKLYDINIIKEKYSIVCNYVDGGEMLKKLSKLVFSRITFVIAAVLIQFLWILIFAWKMSQYFGYINAVLSVVGVIVVLRILNKWENPSYKLAWATIILFIPVFGLTIYAMFGRSGLTRKKQHKFAKIHEDYKKELKQKKEIIGKIKLSSIEIERQVRYIADWADFPVYENTQTKYFPSGEEMFVSMCEELEKAEHFIFMEYFIIEEGEMWNKILNILERKAKSGVDVRLVYDDVGCATLLPARFYKTLQKKGIKCAAFNPCRPVLSVIMNNRDHRKILVIDGHTGYTGGINLADEYINKKVRFGYWKDTGIILKGDAVWNLTVMFLEMWTYITGIKDEHQLFYSDRYLKEEITGDGFVQPYADSPLDHETVGENVYMNIIARAKEYVYICTPYLIIDNEMTSVLCLAAKSGVDVRIITPGIPDKKIVYIMTQSYYERLIDAGVRIYQYKPGFIHAKSFVSDDKVATVGSINLDYRSLYMHFECGVYMYQSSGVMQVKDDFLNTLNVSEEITTEFCKSRSWFIRTFQGILRMVAPLF